MFRAVYEHYTISGNTFHINSFLPAPLFLYISLSAVIKKILIHFVDCLFHYFVLLSQIFSQLIFIMSNSGKFWGTETNKH
jgi:hypothetical protein